MSEMPESDRQGSPRRSWWGRNWLWVVPLGCLTPVLVCGGFIALIATLVFGTIKSSDVYVEALAKAKENKAVEAALGTPIQEGFLVAGNIQINNANGNADLMIPISGPNGTATIVAVAQKAAGKWTFSVLEVVVDGAEKHIDLLKKE